MVAIRPTHIAGFDPERWSATLKLPQEDKAILHRTHEFVIKCIEQRSKQMKARQLEVVKKRFARLSAEIVEILLELNMDLMSLQVAILYPAYENGYVSKADLNESFGEEITKVLMNVRDMEAIRFLQTLQSGTINESQVESVRRMMLAMVQDVRSVVIKLAERVAVIRAAKNADDSSRRMLASEVANIYAPLANRLGIGQLKWELEDLAFRYLHPETYMEIARDLGERRIEREQYIAGFVEELRGLLKKEGITAEVYGRPKHIYSIWRKMQRKHLDFDEIYDVRAVRVVVEKLQDCYAALGVVHTRWQQIAQEFDDYIANPKPNGYKSLHTVVYGSGGKAVEIQIRTREMHNSAELGVAAHWKYKEGSGQSVGVEQRIKWLRKLLAWRDDMVESGALLDEFRTQVFEDRVYVFTPRGEVFDLPVGATPLDFAYQVHTMVGHRCIGAKVNGRIVPFTYKLSTGEQVEIITQKNPNPSRDWLNQENGFLNTSRARSKVASWFRKLDYDKNRESGMEILDKELQRRSVELSREQLAGLLRKKFSRFNVKSMDDVYAGVGAGDISVNAVFSCVEEQQAQKYRQEREDKLGELIAAKSAGAVQQQKLQLKSANIESGGSSIIVEGTSNVLTHIAHCCQPIPGDRIVGFVTRMRGVSIHRADCPQIKKLASASGTRLVRAEWGKTSQGAFSVTVRITGPDYAGFLRDVTTVIANEKINVLGVRSRVDRNKDMSIIDIDLMLANIPVLNRTLAKLKAMPSVSSASRLI